MFKLNLTLHEVGFLQTILEDKKVTVQSNLETIEKSEFIDKSLYNFFKTLANDQVVTCNHILKNLNNLEREE